MRPNITEVYNLNNSIFNPNAENKQLNKTIINIWFGIFIFLKIIKKIKIVLNIKIIEIMKYWGKYIKLKNASNEKKITYLFIRSINDIS